MNNNHPQHQSVVRLVHLTVGILFCLFCFVYLWKVQGSMLGMAQHILSAGLTVYEPVIGALVLTSVLFLVQKVLNSLLRLGTVFYVFSYFPSFLLLIVLGKLPADLYAGTWGAWIWIVPVMMVVYIVLLFVVLLNRSIGSHRGSGVEVRLMLPNMLFLVAFIFLTLFFSHTDGSLIQQTVIEQELNKGELDRALQLGAYRMDCNARTQALRAFILARQGRLGDELFQYPQPYASEGLWIQRADSVQMQYDPDSLYFYLGAYPSAQTTTATQFLEYLNLSEKQCKPMARDYLLCAYLLDKNLPAFVQELSHQQGIADSVAYPKHYQEALVLYKHRYDPNFTYHNPEQEKLFTLYQYLLRSQSGKERAVNITQSDYGKTYWWYYDCYQHKK